MVVEWPGVKNYWVQLGGTYAQMNQDETAYFIALMMYTQGMYTSSSEIERISSISINFEVPHRAARYLEKGFSDGVVDKDDGNYSLLASAYMESREWKKSIEPLTEAARRSGDGKLYLFLCQSYLRDRKYKSAESACVSAINKRGLSNMGDAWLQLGSARYADDRPDKALDAFKEAAKYDKSARYANSMIAYIRNEKLRAEQTRALEAEIRRREEAEAAKYQRD